jgi:hypothetical protein
VPDQLFLVDEPSHDLQQTWLMGITIGCKKHSRDRLKAVVKVARLDFCLIKNVSYKQICKPKLIVDLFLDRKTIKYFVRFGLIKDCVPCNFSLKWSNF